MLHKNKAWITPTAAAQLVYSPSSSLLFNPAAAAVVEHSDQGVDPIEASSSATVKSPQATAELNRINQESLRNYAIFRENMLTHFALTKLRKRHGVDLECDEEG